jgi:hypothetical protein
MAELNMANIRYVENGEPHDETTYNRPVQDLADETEVVLVDLRAQVTQAQTDAIVFSIALG